MKNYKIYILGALLLIGGVAIGWLLKPAMGSTSTHDHSSHDMDDMPSTTMASRKGVLL